MFIFLNDVKLVTTSELKDMIKLLEKEIQSREFNLSAVEKATCKGLLQEGFKIDCIKYLRQLHPGLGLKDAKDKMEALLDEFGLPNYKPGY